MSQNSDRMAWDAAATRKGSLEAHLPNSKANDSMRTKKCLKAKEDLRLSSHFQCPRGKKGIFKRCAVNMWKKENKKSTTVYKEKKETRGY